MSSFAVRSHYQEILCRIDENLGQVLSVDPFPMDRRRELRRSFSCGNNPTDRLVSEMLSEIERLRHELRNVRRLCV